MKLTTTLRSLAAATLMTGASLTTLAHEKGAPLKEAQKTFLSQYEAVRTALAADDLTAAKKAAGAIADNENAAKLAEASSIADARDAFKLLSKKAVHLAEKQEGYYTAHCPMVKDGGGDWVQTTKTINNPYFGKSMLTCGSIKE